MNKKISAFLLATIVLTAVPLTEAQQPGKIPTIGFMRGGSPTDPEVEAFRQGLRELGYVEGKNIIIDFRITEGKTDRFAGVAAELVRLKVDVIVAAGGSAVVLAAKPATDTIPINGANELVYGFEWKTCRVAQGGSSQALKRRGPLEPR